MSPPSNASPFALAAYRERLGWSCSREHLPKGNEVCLRQVKSLQGGKSWQPNSDLAEDLVAHGIDELLERPRGVGLEKYANPGKNLLGRVAGRSHLFWNEFLVERGEIAACGRHP